MERKPPSQTRFWFATQSSSPTRTSIVSSFDCVTSQKSVREGGYGKDFLPVQLMHPLEMKLRMNSEPGNLNLVAAV